MNRLPPLSPPPHAAMVHRPRMLVLTGTSGSGKGTLASRLIAEQVGPLRFARPVTATDRDLRPDERDGFDYHFLTSEEFRRMAASGEFYEYHAVYGQMKGVPRFAIDAIRAGGAIPVLLVDVQGARSIHENAGNENVLTVFISPGSTEVLKGRILARNPEMDGDELERRLAVAEAEMVEAHTAGYVDEVVENHDGELEAAWESLVETVDRHFNGRRDDVWSQLKRLVLGQ